MGSSALATSTCARCAIGPARYAQNVNPKRKLIAFKWFLPNKQTNKRTTNQQETTLRYKMMGHITSLIVALGAGLLVNLTWLVSILLVAITLSFVLVVLNGCEKLRRFSYPT